MEASTYIALSRQGGLRRQLDVIANNLANMNTTGFKGEKMMFVEHLVRSRGGHKPIGTKISYIRDIATLRDFSEGPLEGTGNPLDVAIKGDGFFYGEDSPGGPLHPQRSLRVGRRGPARNSSRASGPCRRGCPGILRTRGYGNHDRQGRHHFDTKRRSRETSHLELKFNS